MRPHRAAERGQANPRRMPPPPGHPCRKWPCCGPERSRCRESRAHRGGRARSTWFSCRGCAARNARRSSAAKRRVVRAGALSSVRSAAAWNHTAAPGAARRVRVSARGLQLRQIAAPTDPGPVDRLAMLPLACCLHPSCRTTHAPGMVSPSFDHRPLGRDASRRKTREMQRHIAAGRDDRCRLRRCGTRCAWRLTAINT